MLQAVLSSFLFMHINAASYGSAIYNQWITCNGTQVNALPPSQVYRSGRSPTSGMFLPQSVGLVYVCTC